MNSYLLSSYLIFSKVPSRSYRSVSFVRGCRYCCFAVSVIYARAYRLWFDRDELPDPIVIKFFWNELSEAAVLSDPIVL